MTRADSAYAETAPGLPPPALGFERTVTELDHGRSIAFVQRGAGRDCVLIHGSMMTLEDMGLGPMAALAEHFRVTALDRPGHGESRRERLVDASPWRQAALIHQFVRASGLDRPIIVGHSYGGTVALAYAAQFPFETAGVLCLAPMCMPEVRLELMLFGTRALPGFGEALAPALGVASDLALLPLLWRAMFLPQTMPTDFARDFPFPLAARFDAMIAEGEDAAALPAALARLVPAYCQIEVPVRILGGTADAVVNNLTQGCIAAAVMPRATFTWLPGVGHMLHHFEHAPIVETALELRDRTSRAP